MEESCSHVPEQLQPEHSYHPDCYQRFTNNLHRLQQSSSTEETQQQRTSQRISAPENIIFNPDCIFCNKEGRKKVKTALGSKNKRTDSGNLTTTTRTPRVLRWHQKEPKFSLHRNINRRWTGSVGKSRKDTSPLDSCPTSLCTQKMFQDQDVPGWAGFISLIGEKPERKTTIGYYPVINHPITDYKTVQECLKQAEEATPEVGQNYVVTTFDLGACMKAFPLVWNQPLRYQQHIILVGTFHTICAYLKVIGKKMEGSGLSDIMQEAGLITSGSVNGVMSGKSYDRSMHCHKVILECLERLISCIFSSLFSGPLHFERYVNVSLVESLK
ncbi:hypothetical protein ACOMHN_061436 [Nucella lapillus]